ncbi:MAG: hypothetical protein GY927_11055 [bacterium]|nr:hypothetical protein [bacterium]
MVNIATAGIGELYNHILNNAQIDEYVVARDSATLGVVSFVSIDAPTRDIVMPAIDNMSNINRNKACFMLDASLLNLLCKRDIVDSKQTICIDVHFGTLMKTAFRTRYLVVLADFVKQFGERVLLNITSVPGNFNTLRLCDLLRYLIPILDNVSIEVSVENIMAQDLPKISAKYFVLTVRELSAINASKRRNTVLGRLSKLPDHNKEIIIRDLPEPAQKAKSVPLTDDVFYL